MNRYIIVNYFDGCVYQTDSAETVSRLREADFWVIDTQTQKWLWMREDPGTGVWIKHDYPIHVYEDAYPLEDEE